MGYNIYIYIISIIQQYIMEVNHNNKENKQQKDLNLKNMIY